MDQSAQQEKELIGAIIKDGTTFAKVLDVLPVTAFNSVMCQNIYRAMNEVYSEGLTIDAVTIGDQLERKGQLAEITHDIYSGRIALGKLRELGHPKHVQSYALNVQDYYGKRELLGVASRLAEWSANGRRANSIITDGRKLLDEVEHEIGAGSTRAFSASQAASKSYDEAVTASQGNGKNFMPTGITALDKWFKMRRKNLTIVAGRPSKGKSAFLVTVALNNALDKLRNGTPGKVLFISMEMSVEELASRFISQLSEVHATRIIDGLMNETEWEQYNAAVERLEKLGNILFILDLSGMTLAQIRNEAHVHFKDGEENFLIVDYLQLAQSGSNKQTRNDEVGAVARGLKVLAQDRDICVLAAAQLSRAIDARADKRPVLSDLRESGSLEQDANNVLLLHSEDNELAAGTTSPVEIRRIIVAKQRNGATSYDKGKGDIEVRWNAPIMRFENIELKNIQL